jgi:hypothetical protein
MVLTDLFGVRTQTYEKLKNGAGATKLNNATVANGWSSTTFTATADTILIGINYYFRVIAAPGAWNFYVEITQSGSAFNVAQMTENATFTSGIQSVQFNTPIYLRTGDTIKYVMTYAGNMTLHFWGDVVVEETN